MMGNYLPAPNLRKLSVNGSLDEYPLRWTASEMQGWREHMEDSHLIYFDLPAKSPVHLFGVFDGHGGAHVARYVASNLVSTLIEFPEFIEGDYAAALKAAYLYLDEQLWLEKAQPKLLQYINQYQPSLNIGVSRSSQIPLSKTKHGEDNNDRSYLKNCLTDQMPPMSNPENAELLSKENKNIVSSTQNLNCKDFEENVSNQNHFNDSTPSNFSMPLQSTVLIQSPAIEATIDKNVNALKKDNFGMLLQKKSSFLHKHLDEDVPKDAADPSSAPPQDTSSLVCLEDMLESQKESPTHFFSGVKTCFADMMHAAKRIFRLGKVSKYANENGCLAMLSGCTAVTCLITKTEYIVANVGDSRCVLCRKDTAIDLSTDHKPQLPEELKRIFSAGGYLWMGRVNGNLNLSRAIGDLTYKQNPSLPPEKQIVSAYPEVTITSRNDDDEFLVIGCDGIWELMSSQGVVSFIRERIERCDKLSMILEELFELNVSPNPDIFECGCDNMTSILVDLKGIDRNLSEK